MRKLIYLIAGLALAFAAADATSRTGATKPHFDVVYQPQENGDYRLSIYGGRELVCEEQALHVTDPTAIDPIIIDCMHDSHVKRFTSDPQFAEGEWKMQVHIPPCAVKHGKPNIEVNFAPGKDGEVDIATIECNEMPVETR